MIGARALRFAGARPAFLVGLLAAYVGAVDLARRIGPALLRDPEPAWAPWRLLLGLGAAGVAATAGAAAAALFLAWARTRAAAEPLAPLPLRRATLVGIAVAALAAGAGLRFWELQRVPEPLWVDDLSLIRPALELSGAPADFADSVRATPFGVRRPYGSIGVLYLEGYRAILRLSGTTVLGVRLSSALAGTASLVTAALLGRALLPAGGGMLSALVLAGLRWHLILSRWAWNMIVLAPIVDLATLALLVSRRRGRAVPALLSGVLAGIGAHVYLSAWPAAAGLALFALWPAEPGEPRRAPALRSGAFLFGFALCVAPLFLLREGRAAPYFARTADHNVSIEMKREKSWLPPLAAAADALISPWLLADPSPRNDLPGHTRLGWIYGVPVAIALGRALLRPRDALSGLLLAHAAAFFAAVVAGGQADNPNGSRFAYLSTLTAVAVSAGTLWIVGRVPPAGRRAAAIGAVGVIGIVGALGSRDALLRWPGRIETFVGFHGGDTRIGRAAARWDRYGTVEVAPGVGDSRLAVEAVWRFRLDPDLATDAPRGSRNRRIRIVAPGAPPAPAERAVEWLHDPRGRPLAVVLARRVPVG